MNTTLRTTAIFRAAVACAATFAGVSAHAVDWTGYMRGGPAVTDGSGKSR